jgi:3-oxoacyl-[acyl-carrier protein] reductase
MELQGQVALVTGGSRGIGRSIAEELSKMGATVIINYTSNVAAAEEARAACGEKALIMQFDVGSAESVDKAFEEIKQLHGKLDILINNAGVARDGLLMRFKNEDWDKTISTNLSGTFYCARAASKMMLRAKSGKIINISSVVGEMGNAGQSAYVASKAGVIGLTKTMARELSSRNITVNAVAPGFIETDMTHALSPELREEHFKAIPLGRYGQPKEIADAVAFLASPRANYITGQVLGINGGMYM